MVKYYMQYKESVYPNDWFRIGDQELIRAKNLLELEDFGSYRF